MKCINCNKELTIYNHHYIGVKCDKCVQKDLPQFETVTDTRTDAPVVQRRSDTKTSPLFYEFEVSKDEK